MTISLYEASIPNFLQTLDAVSGYLDKARAHFQQNGVDLETIVGTSLYPDMRPFRFQVQQTVFHSRKATDAILSGTLNLPGPQPEHDYAALQLLVTEARDALRQVTPDAVNARAGADMVYEAPGRPRRVFTTEGYLMSFALPNFHFHATVGYAILRSKGAPLGKLDYIGALRLKT